MQSPGSSDVRPGSEPIPARRSLRWRLPVALTSLIAAVIFSFVFAADRAVERTLVGAAGDRADRVAHLVASIVETRRALADLKTIAGAPGVRGYLQTRQDDMREPARRLLAALAPIGPRRVELWDAVGTRVLDVSVIGTAPDGKGASIEVPAGNAPTGIGISPLEAIGGLVYSDAVADVTESDTSGARRLGFIRVRTTFAVNPPGIINRLVGDDATVLVGNTAHDVFTDFSKRVPSPGANPSPTGHFEYRRADGTWRVAASAPIDSAPWIAWAEFPRDQVVAPAKLVLRRMLAVAGLFLALGAVLVRLVAGRITKPITELSDAAASLAGGNYAGRVAVHRDDEIGRLGLAFNTMAGEVGAAQDRLESRVQQRTAELATARREAERANQAKSAFLSGMSHDLRTPLNAILGFAQLLELDDPGSERTDAARQIVSGGRYLLELIDEVLDITRIEAGQLSLSPEPVSVRDVVQRATDLIRPLALQRGIELSVTPAGPHDAVRADRQRLGQVLLNLLSNAVKYNRPGGRVRVTSQRVEGGRYRILLEDTGAGIPASKLDLLFRPFERLGAEQSDVQGTGLGLAHSRALAQAMGGSIGVESVVDTGSTFWVELDEAEPVAVREAVASVAPPPRLAARASAGRILYIEDNASNVRLMERIVRQRPGVQLDSAADGAGGLAMIRQSTPDLVLLDVHLPDMSGEDVLRRLWEDPSKRNLPIAILTADATPGLARRLKAAGAAACLTKPLNIKDVLDLFDSVLGKSAA